MGLVTAERAMCFFLVFFAGRRGQNGHQKLGHETIDVAVAMAVKVASAVKVEVDVAMVVAVALVQAVPMGGHGCAHDWLGG